MDRAATIERITQGMAVLAERAAAGDEGARLNLDYLSSRGFVTSADLAAASDDELAAVLESVELYGEST